jgi:type II secretory pathway predicted ATPase ExeA/outer membrane protein OmpA-like peptidoglycan-associated protein
LASYAPEESLQNQLFVHFGLRENPFGGTPDPRFLFHSETHREAIASLINGVACEFGFQVLVAQPGMGKTTLLFNFLERFRNAAHTAFLFQPQMEPRELLQSLLFELGSGSEETSVRKLSEQINQLLGRAAEERKRVIVVVDEAQNLDFAVLETLRQLSNFETPRAKLMQIILAGQPQLVRKLAAPEQEQLRQRISTISRLSPLSLNETRAYINHRLGTAGYRGADLFSPGAVRKIWENGKGVPRNVNTLCFNAMLLGFAGNKRAIDETVLEEATRDLDMPSVLADMYRMEPSLAIPPRNGRGNGNGHGNGNKIQRIWETRPAEPENMAAGSPPDAQVSMSQNAGIHPGAAASGNGSSNGTAESIPPSLIEAIVRISQTLEEQKILLAAKSGHVVEAAPVIAPTVVVPAKLPETVTAVSKAPGSSIAAKGKTEPLAKQGKNITTQAKPVAANNQPKPEKIAVAANAVSESPAASSSHPAVRKPAESGGFWSKAFALAAITCILTFVVVEKSPWRSPAQASGNEDSRPASEQGDSASGYSVSKGSSASAFEGSTRPSKAASTNSAATRDSGADTFDDVTVRKIPAESASLPGASTGAQDPKTVFFDQDSSVIAAQYRSALQQIADILARDPEASAILEGHTDNSGPETYNLDLSSRRANAVREALIDEFNVPSTRLTAIGSGSTSPVQPNSSATGRAYNRRVAVRLVRLGE